jgi:hypothetical protein
MIVVYFGDAGRSLARDFYVKRLVSLPVAVALPEEHPLGDALRLPDLRREVFVGKKRRIFPVTANGSSGSVDAHAFARASSKRPRASRMDFGCWSPKTR